jgi:hypothetical protein
MVKRQYKVLPRNGYYGVDEFLNDKCVRMIDSGVSKKQANALAGAIDMAINQYEIDNKIGEYSNNPANV